MPGWSDRRTRAGLEANVVFAAWERGAPAGYVSLRQQERDVVVEQLLVAPGHERRGIGRRLLAHAEGYAIDRHASTLRIVVERDNRSARRLYRRLGYVPIGDELFELVLPGLSRPD